MSVRFKRLISQLRSRENFNLLLQNNGINVSCKYMTDKLDNKNNEKKEGGGGVQRRIRWIISNDNQEEDQKKRTE
jgi:hypothetical protein